MNRYALVIGGTVVQVLSANYDPDGEGQLWVADPGGVAEAGGTWDGASFGPAPDEPGVIDEGNPVALAQKAAAIQALPDSIKFLDSAERGIASKLFPEWRVGIAVKVGEVYRFEGAAYRVIQAHTTQSDYTPPIVPALFEAL